MRGLGRDRVRAGGLPFPAFAVAALHAGLVSGLVRPVVEAHIVVAGALAAGVLLGGIHWLALRQWRRLRAVVGGAPQPGR